MSRYLQKDIHDEWIEMIQDPKACRLLIDDICCCHDSEFCCEWPEEEDCKKCPHFVPEEEDNEEKA